MTSWQQEDESSVAQSSVQSLPQHKAQREQGAEESGHWSVWKAQRHRQLSSGQFKFKLGFFLFWLYLPLRFMSQKIA